MNSNEINAAIAKELGWVVFDSYISIQDGKEVFWWKHPEIPDQFTTDKLPNFYGSLDCCAQMEATLLPTETHAYEDQLALAVFRDDKDEYWQNGKDIRAYCFHATAPQRCESFLRLKSLWKE